MTEREITELLEQRDRAEEAADELVHCIERLLSVECGEHSNKNCPWTNAIELATEYADRRSEAQAASTDELVT